ncbi:replication initiation and membrane attachment family protein [Lacticaseibacillus parakribbianus]|uniref:replication initiation and membrane attachment family protein n=1 Tax=Lacticaseibacillus parakribbianus TaxID=2970927 RepID=UPI0021CAF93D|nr:DnaD domain protein [Lacticaseibacillus parakribbianus]
MQRPANFMAQDDYIISTATYFSNLDQDVAISLYQPLIGPTALALYLSLWQVAPATVALRERQKQTALLDMLGVSLDELYEARVRLEAVALLQTYTQVDDLGRFYAYELHRPVEPDSFFHDPTLGLLLYDRVGEQRYHQLTERYTLRNVHNANWTNISAQLLDVFSLTRVAPTEQAAADNAQVRQKPTPAVTLGDGQGFDWALVAQLLRRTNVDVSELERNRARLYQIAKFYGLAPVDLARLIEPAVDFVTGGIDLRQVRLYAEQTYQEQAPHLVPKSTVAAAPEPVAAATGKLSADEAALVARASKLSVREFLEATKKAKNPNMYAAPNEIAALRKLVQRHVLPDATINVLVDYILQTNDSLNQAYLDAIVNRWLKAGVTDPASALAEIKAFAERKTRQPARRSNSRPARQEQMPAWSKADYKPKEQAVSSSQQAEIAARLAALRQLEEHGGSGQ